jgi:hypothetical protein
LALVVVIAVAGGAYWGLAKLFSAYPLGCSITFVALAIVVGGLLRFAGQVFEGLTILALDWIPAFFSGSARVRPPRVPLSGARSGYGIEVTGEADNQATLENLAGQLGERSEFVVVLRPEADNPYDPSAVLVATVDGRLIGYLSKQDSTRYHSLISQVEARGLPPNAHAVLKMGQGRRGRWQVAVDLLPPRELAAKLNLKLASPISK